MMTMPRATERARQRNRPDVKLSDWVAAQPVGTPLKDVLLFVAPALSPEGSELWEAEPPLRERCEIRDGLALEPLSAQACEQIIRVSRTTRYDYEPVEPMYALTVPRTAFKSEWRLYDWDARDDISLCLTLARLICPTGSGFDLSATLSCDADGNAIDAAPAPTEAWHAWAGILRGQHKLWLTLADAKRLRDLYFGYRRVEYLLGNSPLGDAFWRFSDCPYVHEFQLRYVATVSTLERLIRAGKADLRSQFCTRVPQLAQLVGLTRSRDWADHVYSIRSRPAHGDRFYVPYESSRNVQKEWAELNRTLLQSLCEVEELLRAVLSEGLLNGELQALLLDGTRRRPALQARWPVVALRGCPECREGNADSRAIECPQCDAVWTAPDNPAETAASSPSPASPDTAVKPSADATDREH